MAYSLLGMTDYLPPKDVYRKAREFALKAIEIDPTTSEAHAILASVKLLCDWDWEGAERAFKKAIELNPNGAYARMQYAYHLLCLGRTNEALAEMTTANSLDPLRDSLVIGISLLRMGRLTEAREQFQKSVDSEPKRAHALWMLGHVDVLEWRYEEGLSRTQKALALSDNNSMILAGLGWSSAVAGKRTEAIKVLNELRERSRCEQVHPYLSAKIYSALGEIDLAFDWLDKAYREHDISLVTILTDESVKRLRQDPRFDELLKKMKLIPAT